MNNLLDRWKNDCSLAINRTIAMDVSSIVNLKEGEIRKIIQLGVNIRLYIIRENLVGIYDALTKENYVKLNMDINSFYLHLKGILDNFSLIINELFDLKVPRVNIDLSKNKFKNKLEPISPNVYELINEYSEWLKEIKSKRDPAAHRKPLYIPPGIVTNEAEYKELDRINKVLKSETDTAKIFEQSLEWGKATKFHSYMIQHDESKIEHIENTILKDLKMLAELNQKLFKGCGLV